jgi:hypothetical protein
MIIGEKSYQMQTTKSKLNCIHLALDYYFQNPRPTSIPIDLYLEPTTHCNLQCSACPTGEGLSTIKERTTTEIISSYLDELGQYLHKWHLFNWGEPTIHPEFARIINILSAQQFTLYVSSNFSRMLNENDIEALSDALFRGLSLKIDMDGFTHDVQQAYRKGSKVEIVKENCIKLARRIRDGVKRGRTGLTRPWIAFLEFDHNMHEKDLCRQFAKELGFDFKSYSPAIQGVPGTATSFTEEESNYGCSWLYSNLVISPSGKRLFPCCGGWAEHNSIVPEEISPAGAYSTWSQSHIMASRRDLSLKRTRMTSAQLNAILTLNNLTSDAMDLRQNEITVVDLCERCNLGHSYHQNKNYIFHSALASSHELFRSDRLTRSLQALFRNKNSDLQDIRNTCHKASAALNEQLTDISPSNRKMSHYEDFIRNLQILA